LGLIYPMAFVVDPQSYRDAFAELREYDGWRCCWCPLVSGLIFLGLYGMPVVGGVASVYLGGDSHSLFRVALGVCLALVLAALSRRLLRDQPWLMPLKWRLRRYEAVTELSTAWPVLLREADYDRAQKILRRAWLSPHSGRRTFSPPDTPQLDATFTVSPTRATPAGVDLKAKIADLLSGVGIEGRAGGHAFKP
jgi:hypothetical protein